MPRRSTLTASAVFTGAGVAHFVRPDFFEAVVPDWFPDATLANRVSGAAEIALGLGLLPSTTRRWAALGLVGLLAAVFPANVDQAVNRVRLAPVGGRVTRHVGAASTGEQVLAWVRLPLQLPLAWWMVREARAAPGVSRRWSSAGRRSRRR